MIQVRLRPELEAQVAEEARANGVGIENYVEKLLEGRHRTGSREESESRQAVMEMLAFTSEYPLTLGGEKIADLLHEGHER